VARVKSHIARFRRLTQKSAAQNAADIDFGWLVVNHGARRVFVHDREITLTNKEYELLYLLARNDGIVFGKEHLYDKIWGEDMYGDMKTVAVHINRLREKVETDSAGHEHIQTVWGAGYRFMR
jgi:DNA-binding response OmpR family regulator